MLERAEHWTPPDSLGYSSLRPVRLTGRGNALIAVAVALVIGAIALGVFLGGIARRLTEEQRLLRTEGIHAEATVTRAWIDDSKERQPWIAYRFEYAGRGYTQRVKTPRKIWPGLSKGATVPVRFVPSQPSISHPIAWNGPAFPLWLACLLAGSLAALSLLLPIAVRRQARSRPGDRIQENRQGHPGPLRIPPALWRHRQRQVQRFQTPGRRFAPLCPLRPGESAPQRALPALSCPPGKRASSVSLTEPRPVTL